MTPALTMLPARIELFVPGRLPSPNDRPGHWAEGRRAVKTARDRIEAALWAWFRARGGKVTNPAQPKRVTFTLQGPRRLDDDNAVASCKVARDALVLAGVIHSDGPECGHVFSVNQQTGRTLPRGVWITVEKREGA